MVKVSTEDGSMGYKGIVTQLLHEELNKLPPEGHAIYACGPHEMLRSIAMMSKNYGIPCQVSLESRMACGIGACMGCSLRVLPERGKDVARENPYKRVCLDGPVFNSREVDWNSL
jgi:dihydroorotate dehydrogenase electron transfer subunit